MNLVAFEEFELGTLLWLPSKYYANNFNISEAFKDVSNTPQNFTFTGAVVFEMAGGSGRSQLLGIRCGYQKAW